jgi:hypothetical protein
MYMIGSKVNGSVHEVQGMGLTESEARSNAIQIGRALHHIADPIALPEHEAAVRTWRMVTAASRPATPKTINGSSPMCFERRFYLD